jgi:hypothetical protein
MIDAEQAHGPLSALTITIRAHLAWCLADLGQLGSAADTAALAASAAERSYGSQHPDTQALHEDAARFAAGLQQRGRRGIPARDG